MFEFDDDEVLPTKIALARLTSTQTTLLITGASLFVIGFISFGLLLVLEAVRDKRARKKAIELYDELIIPPRCEDKAAEISLTKQLNWKKYFYREEPFFYGAE